jgi:hypothetical protein
LIQVNELRTKYVIHIISQRR